MSSIGMTQADQLKEQINALEAALEEDNAQMPGLLQEIHMRLKQDADVVTILSDAERAIIVKGLSKMTQTVITTAKVKSNKTAKRGASLSIGTDL